MLYTLSLTGPLSELHQPRHRPWIHKSAPCILRGNIPDSQVLVSHLENLKVQFCILHQSTDHQDSQGHGEATKGHKKRKCHRMHNIGKLEPLSNPSLSSQPIP